MNSRFRIIGMALLLPSLAGCLTADAVGSRWMDRFQIFRPPLDSESAFVEYVLIERPQGDEVINRRVWDRIDEMVLPLEVKTVVEENGLRVGVISGSTPGPLRGLIEDPRTDRGHRFRSFHAEKPISLAVTPMLPKADFNFTAGNHPPVLFAHDQAQLGFQLSISPGKEGTVILKCVPEGKFRDPKPFSTDLTIDREFSTEQFTDGTFEIALGPTEYLVIGTDVYREKTFGHASYVGMTNEKRVQRLLVIKAGQAKAERQSPPLLNGKEDTVGTPPLASQASVIRASGRE
ncbi:hypothetical protein [Zavarzinella formosa]|uniref:hypothetical protein n=1 Tax=Zavarzinella formosa TaxID=360055 RepID=UPI0002D9F582|nr:hypothetical protein [Zavarzinella formosa]